MANLLLVDTGEYPLSHELIQKIKDLSKPQEDKGE